MCESGTSLCMLWVLLNDEVCVRSESETSHPEMASALPRLMVCVLVGVALSETVDNTLAGRKLLGGYTMEDLVVKHLTDENRKAYRRTESRQENVDVMLKAANDLNTNQLSLEHVNPGQAGGARTFETLRHTPG